MKKTLVILILIAILSVMIVLPACNNDKEEFTQYFNNYSSTSAYTVAKQSLVLPENVYVSSYDSSNNVYVTEQTITVKPENSETETKLKRYGLCSSSEVYVNPEFVSVVEIRGDYAIVTCSFIAPGTNRAVEKIGVIRYRGSNRWRDGFSYERAPLITQYQFLDDRYVIVKGSIQTESTEYSYATIYDYVSTNGLMEVAKIKFVDNSSLFTYGEGYLAVTSGEITRYYNINDIDSEGYLTIQGFHSSFDLSEGWELNKLQVDNYYLGNGWFITSSIYASTEQFDGAEIMEENESAKDESEKYYYLCVRTVRYSVNAKTSYPSDDRVVMVANKYSSDLMKGLADVSNAKNNSTYVNVDDEDKRQAVYFTPVVPTSEIIKDGYSIVYSYYYRYTSENAINWDTTFRVYDANANPILIENVVMPIVYVDGYGIQNIDPNFSLPLREVAYHSYNDGVRHSLKEMTTRCAYDNVLIHNGVMLTLEMNLDTMGGAMMMSAYDLATGVQILPPEYYSITPYFGNYALCSKTVTNADNTYSFEYYRADKVGNVTRIYNVFSAHNGVYVTKENGAYGLYANDGTQLITARCDSISVVDSFFEDGKYIKTTVATVENGRSIIYTLG